MKLNKGFIGIFILALIVAALSIRLIGPIDWDPDYLSYLKAWDEHLSQGEIDKFRTPLYPLYLGLMKTIFGSHFTLGAIIGQYIVFLLSIRAFYAIAYWFIHSEKIVLGTTLIYAVYPGIIHWSNSLMTESLAISGTVFLLYGVMRLYDRYSTAWTVITAGLMILLLMLRPIFIYLLPTLFLAWIIAFRKSNKRKQAISGLISPCFATWALMAYMAVFYHAYGIFSTSSVSTYNRWYMARESGLLKPEVIDNPALRTDVEKSIQLYGKQFDFKKGDLWDETDSIIEKYDLATLNKVLNASTISQPLENLAKVADTTMKASTFKLAVPASEMSFVLSDLLSLNMAVIYLILIIYTIVLVRWMFNHRQIPWFSSVLYMVGVSHLIIVLIGAQGEWYRLIVPSMPIYILLIGQLCRTLNMKPIQQIDLE